MRHFLSSFLVPARLPEAENPAFWPPVVKEGHAPNLKGVKRIDNATSLNPADGPSPSPLAANGLTTQSLQLTTLREAYAEPLEDIAYCVDDLIPMAGLSVLAGKPKTGKSTLVRDLAGSVAMGTEFLGRSTVQGAVIYLALEEKKSEVTRHFQELGIPDTARIFVHAGAISEPDDAIADIESLVHQIGDVVLVIIDPMFHFLRVKDANDYVVVYPAMQKLVELGRRSGAAVLAIHHLKKRESEDVMDLALGSTAITAAVDSFLVMRTKGKERTIASRQRYGISLDETQLLWDVESRRMSLGPTTDQVIEIYHADTLRRIEQDIVAYIRSHPGCTQSELFGGVVGKTTQKKQALASLADRQWIVSHGSGVRGEPFTYRVQGLEKEPAVEHVGTDAAPVSITL